MTSTTLCYIEKDGCYLMLHRVKKEHDVNEGKWIGVGGHIEPGETPEECIRRETREETGLVLKNVTLRGVVEFVSDRWENEHMYLYTSDDFSGELTELDSETSGGREESRPGNAEIHGDEFENAGIRGGAAGEDSPEDSGELGCGGVPCSEGVLRWIPKEKIFDLNLWEGDRVFLDYLLEGEPFFHLELDYDENDELKHTELLPRLVLASASPRRRELLEQIGFTPIVLPSRVEERMEGATPEEIVKNLSKQKAEDVAERFSDIFHNGVVILGADTIVVSDGEILGKPHSHEEAAEMIRRLAGREHQVYTGVTLIRCGVAGEADSRENGLRFAEKQVRNTAGQSAQKRNGRTSITFAECTDVYVAPMTEEEILGYAAGEEPMDKAGAYGIQGSFAAFIEKIDGDYTTVVGLPIGSVYRHLRALTSEGQTP